MRLEPSDPDLETLVSRILRKDLDLQPAFQRGEVWSRAKKQRLVDSVLRGWHVPPIHVIELPETGKQEVLDGQQRLTAIRDFVRGDFPVDGMIEPTDSQIAGLDGKRFIDLPEPWRRRFNQFTIRVLKVVDYIPEESGELFFRLNQPTSLTSAEQRNAFFGPVRKQVKELVELLEEHGLDKEVLGFSNSRMAYDDIIARVALVVTRNTISEKVTANNLVELYRADKELAQSAIDLVAEAISLFGEAKPALVGKTRFNKATLFSWFVFIIKANAVGNGVFSAKLLGHFLLKFEEARLLYDLLGDINSPETPDPYGNRTRMLRVYDSRASSRVADVSSVVLRDLAIWLEFESFIFITGNQSFPIGNAKVDLIKRQIEGVGSPFDEDLIARNAIKAGWGSLI